MCLIHFKVSGFINVGVYQDLGCHNIGGYCLICNFAQFFFFFFCRISYFLKELKRDGGDIREIIEKLKEAKQFYENQSVAL